MSKLGFNPLPRRTVYYIRPVENGVPKKGVAPVGTVVLLWDNNGNVSRGISICAETDQFVREKGVRDAFIRAKQALADQKTRSPIGFPIGPMEKVRNASMAFQSAWQAQWGEAPGWKQEFKPTLTPYESKLLDKATARVGRERQADVALNGVTML